MSASEALQQLIAMADAAGGVIAPEAVVEAARDPASPLHGAFDWDDASAAHEHRIETARKLIRSVKVEVKHHQYTYAGPAYLRQPNDRSGSYVSVSRLRTDTDAARETVVLEFRRAAMALQRARIVAVLLGLDEEVEGLIGKLDQALSLAERHPQADPGVARS